MIKEANDTLLSVKDQESFTDADWIYLYMVYGRAYPNSKGQPSKDDLVNVLKNAANLPMAYR